mmetsp:Transcript_44855/g.114667  ORF Transcript_44855/g.114667 Transcript_44855/m.114667 type:complete len:298 (+) Transcript_44855:715-1608(+)
MVQNLQKVGVLLAKHLGQQHTCHVAFPPDGRLERVAAVEERVGREVGRHSCHDWRQLVEIAAQHKLHASPGLSDLVALVPDPAHHPLHLEEKLARDHAYLVHHQRPQIAPLLPVPLFKHFPEVLHAHWDAAAGERVQGGAADVRGRDAGCRSDGQQAAVPAVPLAQHRHDVVEQERLAGPVWADHNDRRDVALQRLQRSDALLHHLQLQVVRRWPHQRHRPPSRIPHRAQERQQQRRNECAQRQRRHRDPGGQRAAAHEEAPGGVSAVQQAAMWTALRPRGYRCQMRRVRPPASMRC